MLDHHLKQSFESLPKNLNNLCTILRKNKDNEDNYRGKKALDKMIAMFGSHDFWDTQPVQRCYDLVKTPVGEEFNEPVEVKNVADIPTEPLPLPEGFEWSVINLQDDDQL
jgi:glycylpeptide N-tetradecanoyltransferase